MHNFKREQINLHICVVPLIIHTPLPWKGLFLRPPTPLEIAIKLHTVPLRFCPLRPSTPMNFQFLLWGSMDPLYKTMKRNFQFSCKVDM